MTNRGNDSGAAVDRTGHRTVTYRTWKDDFVFSLQPTSTLALQPAPHAVIDASSSVRPSATRSIWTLALAGLLVSLIAANLVCLWPRWYSGSLLSLAWQSSKMIVVSAAAGAAIVRILWGLLRQPPTASPTRIALILSASWVLLPCVVLLHESNSPWMLPAVALASFAMALGMRILLPLPQSVPEPYRGPAALATLDGLPPRDSPLALASSVAVLAYAALLLAAIGYLRLAAIHAALSVFLLTWQWSAKTSHTAQRWLGPHPPLRQTIVAIVLTTLFIIPFSIGGRGGLFRIGRAAGPSVKPRNPQDGSSGAGYAGIILYPPPVKKQLIAPAPQTDSFQASSHAKPMLIPFDGQYWYFKAPSSRPSARAHIAHARPTEVNVHSTDSDPLEMEAHQNLPLPIDLAHTAEIDVALSNADIRPGEIDLQLLLTDSTAKATPLFTPPQPILSSQFTQIPLNRAAVHETLRFPLPASHTLRRFNQITVIFRPSPRRAHVGAKVSIEGFEIQPKP
ncbi:MAG TPA: hypothetical protein VGU23_09405 [Acidobacteriaceae bacterium]|nr:hypothetical protein [Acidobacteriaceae bacterium]